MANEREFINSFQGKNVDSDELQNLDNNSFFDIVSRYNVSDDGVLTSKIKPRYNNSFNNPAPEDPSRFDPPPPDPIRITRPDALDVPAVRVLDTRDIDVDVSPAGKLERITVSPGRTVDDNRDTGRFPPLSPDAPEEAIDPADRDEADFDLAGYSERSSSGELGPPIGLNESARTNIEINQAKTAAAINDGPFMEDLTKLEINTRPNELNVFSSYTYNIALYMINSKSYVDLTNLPQSAQQVLDPDSGVSKLLMRSGGTGLDADPAFRNDFFIDDLEVTNIAAGPSKFKQNTNAVDIRFTITEPRGVRLLEVLQNAAASVLASTKERYIHAPYLLEITFKGYDEEGRPIPAPSIPKYIPIRITDMQFEVTATGTQYKVQAIPYAHYAMGSIVSTIPFNVELNATTVGDIFSGVAKVIEEVQEERTLTGPLDQRRGDTQRVETKKKPYEAKDLGQVLTDYQKKRTRETVVLSEKNNEVTQNTIAPAAEGFDTYEFKIAGEIAQAKLNKKQLYDALNTPAPTETKEKDSKDKSDRKQFEAYVKGVGQGVTLDKETGVFKINAGTDISKLLNLIIMHSDYMDQNIVDNPIPQATEGDPIKWFKIRPIIQSASGPGKGFDAKDGRYKYNITFAVEKTTIHYNDFPWAKKSKPKGKGVHKQYDYLFSGTNTEVLNLDLKFRTAFMQVMTAQTGSPLANKQSNATFAPLVKELPQSAEGNTTNSQDDIKRARAKDLFSSVMSDGVDMVDLNLQIIGDPAYLPTSDAFYQDKVRQGRSYTEAFMPDGTINYNVSPPYVQVNLKTPTDYDDRTGLANPNQFGNSSFSGVYQVSSVESTFSGGVFQQRVYGFRTPNQPAETGVVRDKQSTANTERDALAKDNEFDSKEPQAIGRGKNTGITNNVARVVTPPVDFAQDAADEFAGGNRIGGEFDTTRDPRVAQQAAKTYVGGASGEFDVTPKENWGEFGGNTLI
tara:strand:+ start:1271 stop:4162 length:2892 start_codon:yes stop_codon:yes gene_type:complete